MFHFTWAAGGEAEELVVSDSDRKETLRCSERSLGVNFYSYAIVSFAARRDLYRKPRVGLLSCVPRILVPCIAIFISIYFTRRIDLMR